MILIVFIISFIGFFMWASFPWSLSGRVSEVDILQLDEAVLNDPHEEEGVIKILTWNLGFLYGKGSEGPGYEYRDQSFFKERMEELITFIRKENPDILCLQEIDFDSSRSGGINQARELALKAGYPYLAQAVSWKANYIPFPYWPLSRNFGSMKSGGAILSKYPLKRHNVELFAKPASNPWWYNLFYLHRYAQSATVTIRDKDYVIMNLHLEAFDKADRLKQVRQLQERVEENQVDFAAGDYNMVPGRAIKKNKFTESTDDYENDESFVVMSGGKMKEAIPEEIYLRSESRYFTFPSWKPDRRLDYIFYDSSHRLMRAEVLSSKLSDHLPLKASFQIAGPKYNIFSQ